MAGSSEEKLRLRKQIKALRSAVRPEEKALWDEQLKERFFTQFLPDFGKNLNPERNQQEPGRPIRLSSGGLSLPDENRRWVYLYLDIRNEAGTLPILKELWRRKIHTAVPKMEGAEINFYEIAGLDETEAGCMGILEPVPGARPWKPAQAEEALVLVPVVAFDPTGGRMGYGGGFYDRFFRREPKHPKWGLAYDFQIADRVPQEPWDQKMDEVITPSGIWKDGRKISI